jgi:hypothetical protein
VLNLSETQRDKSEQQKLFKRLIVSYVCTNCRGSIRPILIQLSETDITSRHYLHKLETAQRFQEVSKIFSTLALHHIHLDPAQMPIPLNVERLHQQVRLRIKARSDFRKLKVTYCLDDILQLASDYDLLTRDILYGMFLAFIFSSYLPALAIETSPSTQVGELGVKNVVMVMKLLKEKNVLSEEFYNDVSLKVNNVIDTL